MTIRQSIQKAPRDGTRVMLFVGNWTEFWGNEEQIGRFEEADDGQRSWVTELGSVPDDQVPGEGLYFQDEVFQALGPSHWAPSSKTI